MADREAGQENAQENSKPCPVLRASAFSTSRSSETGNERSGAAMANNPFAGGLNSRKSRTTAFDNGNTNHFFLRPSPLQHQASLLKEPTLVTAPSTNTFKLEPPKLFSPLSANVFGSTESRDDSSNKPAISTDSASKNGTSSDENSKFVFGEKLESKVILSGKDSSEKTSTQFVFGSNLADRVVISNVDGEKQPSKVSDVEETGETSAEKVKDDSTCLSLVESAAKQQAKEVKPGLKEVEIVTGEENESNVFQFNAKLYVFDKDTQNWQERGRGLLRLNDMAVHDNKPFQSRLVMRAQGSLRVVLNIMLWSGMLIERASHKSVKISAIDPDEGIKIFLISANTNDAEHMHSAILSRMQKLKAIEAHSKDGGLSKKRSLDNESSSSNSKKIRLETTGDESNDSSSAPYPETEASNEGFTSSSPAVQSSSSSDA